MDDFAGLLESVKEKEQQGQSESQKVKKEKKCSRLVGAAETSKRLQNSTNFTRQT